MALNIKDAETERLASEVAALTGESKTEAVRVALQERRDRLARRVVSRGHRETLVRFLEHELWPQIPSHVLGRPVSKAERESILGYEPEGCDPRNEL
jgi:antitoxin VapB